MSKPTPTKIPIPRRDPTIPVVPQLRPAESAIAVRKQAPRHPAGITIRSRSTVIATFMALEVVLTDIPQTLHVLTPFGTGFPQLGQIRSRTGRPGRWRG